MGHEAHAVRQPEQAALAPHGRFAATLAGFGALQLSEALR